MTPYRFYTRPEWGLQGLSLESIALGNRRDRRYTADFRDISCNCANSRDHELQWCFRYRSGAGVDLDALLALAVCGH